MKTLILTITFALVTFSLVSCKSGNPRADREADRKNIQDTLSEEMSLKADRDHLAELRKDIPAETKKANDELALFLGMMKQGTEQPNLVRERFQVLVQKKRQSFREKTVKLRDDFRSAETKRREKFLGEQKSKRDSFTRSKRDHKESREFFSQQDKDRQAFFADERDRRQNFESEMRAQSKDFESYMRERTNEFNEQFRIYSKKLSEKPKDQKAVTGEDGTSGNPFQKLDDAQASPLGTEN